MDSGEMADVLRMHGVEIKEHPEIGAMLVQVYMVADAVGFDVFAPEGSSMVKLDVTFNVWIEKSKEN